MPQFNKLSGLCIWSKKVHIMISIYTKNKPQPCCKSIFTSHCRMIILGPFDRKRVFGVISGNLHVCAPNYTLVFNTSVAKFYFL